jgi:hypothetical protein
MQEHKYHNQAAWVEGGIPHHMTEPIENIHEIVANHYDPENIFFKSPAELEAERIRREDRDNTSPKALSFRPDDGVMDDWTGDHHVENYRANLPQGNYLPERSSMLMIDQDLALDVDLDLESEYGPLSSEPYDPNLANVDKIIKRYDEKDVNEEL